MACGLQFYLTAHELIQGKEVENMPGKDTTGPRSKGLGTGKGPITSKGLGGCKRTRKERQNNCFGGQRNQNRGNGQNFNQSSDHK